MDLPRITLKDNIFGERDGHRIYPRGEINHLDKMLSQDFQDMMENKWARLLLPLLLSIYFHPLSIEFRACETLQF